TQVDVEGDQRRPGPDEDGSRGRVEAGRAEVRTQLARRHAALQLLGATTPKEGGPAAVRRELSVEKDRQAELDADTAGKLERGGTGPLHVRRLDRDERNDVGRTHTRMRPVVATQVDPLAGALHAGEECGDQLSLVA